MVCFYHPPLLLPCVVLRKEPNILLYTQQFAFSKGINCLLFVSITNARAHRYESIVSLKDFDIIVANDFRTKDFISLWLWIIAHGITISYWSCEHIILFVMFTWYFYQHSWCNTEASKSFKFLDCEWIPEHQAKCMKSTFQVMPHAASNVPICCANI